MSEFDGMDFESIYEQVAVEFYEKYMSRDSEEYNPDTMRIAREYTIFIIDRCDELSAEMYYSFKELNNE